MEKKYGGSIADATTRFVVDKHETSYRDGFIIISMWDENGHAYVAAIRTEDAWRMAIHIRDIAEYDLEGEAAEGAL